MAHMNNPSEGVAQPLQNHVHLISGHRFPILPALNIEQAFRYLLDAPTIVKQTAPMAWNYVQAPQDGTVWLEWIPQRNSEYRFPSDGYVWADPEQTARQDFAGYTIEWMSHALGYRPQHEHVATHARTRFHFVSKNPGVNAAPPDPSLWIVHYHRTDERRMMPTNNLPITQQVRQIMAERRYLEQQGRLERKDFMLHDREHWPTINVPGNAHMPPMQQQGMYGNQMMQQQQQAMNQQRFPQYSYPQGQGPPAKRARTSGPTAMPGSSDGVHDISIEDEENVTMGDFFDHMTPREISAARYMQHHRWMEEVFSSPYATSQIVPTDLGLGLMGELKGLTDGILDQPAIDELQEAGSRPKKPEDAPQFTNLKKEQVDEFNKRVEKHLQDGQAEIERMKKEHAEKMAEWNRTKALMQAEKRLRYATWEGHESAMRLEVPATNEHAEESGAPKETVEDVVKEVEGLLGARIEGHKDATMVQKGGLEREEEQPKDEMEVIAEKDPDDAPQQSEPMMSGANGGMDDFDHQPPDAGSAVQAQPNMSQPVFDIQQPEQMSAPADDMVVQGELDDMDMGDNSFMDDMDMDGDANDGGGDIDFVSHDHTPAGDNMTLESEMPDQPAVQPQTNEPTTTADANQPAEPAALDTATAPQTADPLPAQQLEQDQQQQQQPDLTSVEEPSIQPEAPLNPESALPIPESIQQQQSIPGEPAEDTAAGTNLFDDGTFDDLEDVGHDGDDDGLIDFDGGMGMDDSAFGEALHGMDTPGDGGEGGQGAGES